MSLLGYIAEMQKPMNKNVRDLIEAFNELNSFEKAQFVTELGYNLQDIAYWRHMIPDYIRPNLAKLLTNVYGDTIERIIDEHYLVISGSGTFYDDDLGAEIYVDVNDIDYEWDSKSDLISEIKDYIG